MTVIEICVEDAEGVRIARDCGADRVELCDRLDIGGITPSEELICAAIPLAPPQGLRIMIRPRGGDFMHSDSEVTGMVADIERIRDLTASASIPIGFVMGVLSNDFTVNVQALRALKAASGDADLVFHRAFDQTPDLAVAMETIIDCGFTGILTTGGDPAVAQVDRLRDLAKQAGERISIIASGGLRSHNALDVVMRSGVPEVHMRAPGEQGGTDPEVCSEIMRAMGR